MTRYKSKIESLKKEGLDFYHGNVVIFKDPINIGRQDILSISVQLIKNQLKEDNKNYSKEDIKKELSSWVDYLMREE